MMLAKNLLSYAAQGDAAALSMLCCSLVALALVLLKSLQLYLLLKTHDEQMETLGAISQVPSPTFRLQLLRQLRQRMTGLEGRLLDIVLSTPLGGVRSERLAGELAYCRARLEFWFALIARIALAAPAIGFVTMLYVASADTTAIDVAVNATSSLRPWPVVLPLLFGALVSLPALLLLIIADHYWLASLGQVNRHSAQLSQLPTGLERGMV